MAFRNGAYATVWQVEKKSDRVTQVRISTSRKNKQTDQYEQDFSGFVSILGDAAQKALSLREKDRIKLGDVSVTSRFDKEKNKEYVYYNVYDFATVQPFGEQTSPIENNPASEGENIGGSEVPF